MAEQPLWDHQKLAVEKAKTVNDLALFFEAGTGKTRATIEILREIYNHEKRLVPTLIFCPVVVVSNWRAEFLRYSKVSDKKLVLLTGTGDKRVKTYLAADPNSIFITNYEAVQMSKLYHAIVDKKPQVVILDESHRVKNPQGQRTKLVWQICDNAQRRFLLSGTPILNSQMDIFAQFRALDRGETFGANFWSFRAQYFYDKNAGMPRQSYFPNWVARADTSDRLRERLIAKSISVKKSDCLDLPPLVRKEIEVALTTQQERLYKEMKRDFIAFLEDKACVAQLALTKALRLQQIVSGFIKTDDGKEHSFEKNPRQEALLGLLEDLAPNHKVIVWAVFKENYKQIVDVCERLGIKYVQLTGETSATARTEAIESFTKDDGVRVFISNPGAGGIGINLVEASYSIFYSRSFSLEHDLQAEARNYRGGSEQHLKITRIDLVARDTIDEIILKALANKQDIASKILDLKNLL